MTPEQAITALDARGMFGGDSCSCTDNAECQRCFVLSILKTVYAYRGTAENGLGQMVVVLRTEWQEYRSLKRKRRQSLNDKLTENLET